MNKKDNLMGINDKIEYFFYEWLICEKNIDYEEFENLSKGEFITLRKEFTNTYIKLNKGE